LKNRNRQKLSGREFLRPQARVGSTTDAGIAQGRLIHVRGRPLHRFQHRLTSDAHRSFMGNGSGFFDPYFSQQSCKAFAHK
jgi:hypothetical protein